MLPTSSDLRRLAEETGFVAAALEKVERLAELLAAFARTPPLAGSLALKGGTALNLFFAAPRRLSVDVDLNLVGAADREAMLEARPAIEHAVDAVGRRLGYQVQRSRQAFAGRKIYLSYQSTLDASSERIEVDLNFLHRLPLTPLEERPMLMPGGQLGPSFPVLSFDEIAAGKLCALLDRGAARDFWDTGHLPVYGEDQWPGAFSRQIFVAYAGSLAHSLTSYSQVRLRALTRHDVAGFLAPMLSGSAVPEPTRLVADAWAVLEPMLQLTAAEAEFCDRLQLGEIQPELLFPDRPDLADRVARFPPLLWKAENAHRHHDRNREMTPR